MLYFTKIWLLCQPLYLALINKNMDISDETYLRRKNPLAAEASRQGGGL